MRHLLVLASLTWDQPDDQPLGLNEDARTTRAHGRQGSTTGAPRTLNRFVFAAGHAEGCESIDLVKTSSASDDSDGRDVSRETGAQCRSPSGERLVTTIPIDRPRAMVGKAATAPI